MAKRDALRGGARHQWRQVTNRQQHADGRADLQIRGICRLAADHTGSRERLDVVELCRQAGEVRREALGRDAVVAPGAPYEANRIVGAGPVERPAAGDCGELLWSEVKRTPRQAPAEVLKLLVAPSLGLPNLLGGIQDRLGLDLLQTPEYRPRAVDGLAVDSSPGTVELPSP